MRGNKLINSSRSALISGRKWQPDGNSFACLFLYILNINSQILDLKSDAKELFNTNYKQVGNIFCILATIALL